MRRTTFVALLAAASLAAGSAADASVTTFRTPGAQSFALNDGNGRAVVTKRGALLIRVVRGRIRVVDLPGGTRPSRSCNRGGVRVSGVAVEYRGRDVRCRVFGPGPWQVIMRGRGINAGGKVRGSLTLDGVDAGARGVYKIGDRAFRRWPRLATTFVLRR
ncbi:MAG: hypothetical protein ACRDOP_02595 [Gaiellaceae bacterium]